MGSEKSSSLAVIHLVGTGGSTLVHRTVKPMFESLFRRDSLLQVYSHAKELQQTELRLGNSSACINTCPLIVNGFIKAKFPYFQFLTVQLSLCDYLFAVYVRLKSPFFYIVFLLFEQEHETISPDNCSHHSITNAIATWTVHTHIFLFCMMSDLQQNSSLLPLEKALLTASPLLFFASHRTN